MNFPQYQGLSWLRKYMPGTLPTKNSTPSCARLRLRSTMLWPLDMRHLTNWRLFSPKEKGKALSPASWLRYSGTQKKLNRWSKNFRRKLSTNRKNTKPTLLNWTTMLLILKNKNSQKSQQWHLQTKARLQKISQKASPHLSEWRQVTRRSKNQYQPAIMLHDKIWRKKLK